MNLCCRIDVCGITLLSTPGVRMEEEPILRTVQSRTLYTFFLDLHGKRRRRSRKGGRLVVCVLILLVPAVIYYVLLELEDIAYKVRFGEQIRTDS